MALVLPHALDEKIKPLKQKMFDRYRSRTGLKSPAHITMVPPFWMEPQHEAGLKEAMDALGKKVQPFDLTTNGLSTFAPRTIFIAVAENASLHALKKESDTYWQGYAQWGVRTDNRPFHPHITIATRDLQRAHFFDAWPQFEKTPWEESWEAASLSLLRHNGACWEVVHSAPFKKRGT